MSGETEALGAYRAATLIRLQELRDIMTKQIQHVIPHEDSYARTCTTLALQKVSQLWKVAISDFEIAIGHTLPEIQVASLIREKEKLQQRLDHLFDTTEILYKLILGPLPPEVSDDIALVTRLHHECKHLRKHLVDNQHKLLMSPKELDTEHVSLKQLWKLAQNALEIAARAKAFGAGKNNNNNNNNNSDEFGNNNNNNNTNFQSEEGSGDDDERGDDSSFIFESSNNNKNKNKRQQSPRMMNNNNNNNMTFDDYKRELTTNKEVYDLTMELKRKEEKLRDITSAAQATETSLRTRIAEMKARFLSEVGKVKLVHTKYLKKLDQLHDEELSSLVTQTLAALGVSDPVAVEERVDETLSTLREKREKALESTMKKFQEELLISRGGAAGRNALMVVDTDEEDDDEILGDEDDATHGDQPPSPTQRSLASTYRPGGVHKWEGQTLESLRKQLEEQAKEHKIEQANYLVNVKAKTLEWQSQLQEMQQKYESVQLATNASLLREKSRAAALQKTVDDLAAENQKLGKQITSLKQQLDHSLVDSAQSQRFAVLAARREADAKIHELDELLKEKSEKMERLQKKVYELTPRGRSGGGADSQHAILFKDMWIQTDPVQFAEDVKLFKPSRSAATSRRNSLGEEVFDDAFDDEADKMQKSARSHLKRTVSRLNTVSSSMKGFPTAAGDSSAREFNVDSVFTPNTTREGREENPDLSLSGRRNNTNDDNNNNAVGKSQMMWNNILAESRKIAPTTAGSSTSPKSISLVVDDNAAQNQNQLSLESSLQEASSSTKVGSKARQNNNKPPSTAPEKSSRSQKAAKNSSSHSLGSAKLEDGASSSVGLGKRRIQQSSSSSTLPSIGNMKPKRKNQLDGNSEKDEFGDEENGIYQDDGSDDNGDDNNILEDEKTDGKSSPKKNTSRRIGHHLYHSAEATTTTTKYVSEYPSNTLFALQDTSHLTRIGSSNLAPVTVTGTTLDVDADENSAINQMRRRSSFDPRLLNNNNNNFNVASSAQSNNKGSSKSQQQQQQQQQQQRLRSHVILELDPNRANEEADQEEKEEAEEYRRQQQQQTAVQLLATQGPVAFNDSLLTPESVLKTLEVFNTPSYNDSERMKALVVTSTMKPVAVGALPTSVSEKRFFLALARVASFCDTVLVLPRNALPYSIRLQQQLTALGGSANKKAPEDWKMMKKISPLEICVISTYIQTNFSRKSEKMKLLLEQLSRQQQQQNQQQQGPNANSPSGHHLQSQRIEKLESIFQHADAVVSKVRSAQMSDHLKDVTWDELHSWRASFDTSTSAFSSSSVSGGDEGGFSFSVLSGGGGINNHAQPNVRKIVFPARDAAQLLTQIIELLRLWNVQKRQLVEQFAAHSQKASMLDKTFSNYQQEQQNDDEETSKSSHRRNNKNNNDDQEDEDQDNDNDNDEDENGQGSFSSASIKKGSSMFVSYRGGERNNNNNSPSSSLRVRGIAPDSSTLMAEGSIFAGAVSINGPSPPPMSLSALSRSLHERERERDRQQQREQEYMTTSARVRNPRSIRQLIAASNTLVRSARRHVEAQRQASQRGESPQFTTNNLVDLRVVGNTNVKK